MFTEHTSHGNDRECTKPVVISMHVKIYCICTLWLDAAQCLLYYSLWSHMFFVIYHSTVPKHIHIQIDWVMLSLLKFTTVCVLLHLYSRFLEFLPPLLL